MTKSRDEVLIHVDWGIHGGGDNTVSGHEKGDRDEGGEGHCWEPVSFR